MVLKVINAVLIIFLPFLFTGLINRVKSLWCGRKGPSLLQSFRDFQKLLGKGEIISSASSGIFQIAPSVLFSSSVMAALVTPLAGKESFLSFDGDFVFFAYILALGKFFMITGAMDTGSSFEGMGASREATFSVLVEPAFFIILGSFAFINGTASFSGLFLSRGTGNELHVLTGIFAAISLLVMLITEGSRVPVDDPGTHLELTMIHEAMILDNSGPDLALIHYAASLKMVIITALIAAVIIPPGGSPWFEVLSTAVIFFLAALLIGTIESLMARLRMSHIPQFILFMSSLAIVLLAITVLFIAGGLK